MKSNSRILEQAVADTEKIFGRIAENYPNMLKELESSIEDASCSLKSLSHVGTVGCGASAVPVEEYLKTKKDECKFSLQGINAFKKQNEIIIEKLTAAIADYQDSQAYIEEIRDISESLQIVSLNALVNAVKAGKGGEGFSVITENLKNVTGTTIEKTGLLERKGAEVKQQLEIFSSSEKEIAATRKELLVLLEDEMMNKIETFRAESCTVSNLLSDLNKDSEGVRENILRIMEELQQQDIIRQTIDQILMSLNELPDGYETQDADSMPEEENLDKAVFSEKLLDISILMLEEVISKLNRTIEIFSTSFTSARERLEYIRSGKNSAIKHFIENFESISGLSEMTLKMQESSLVLIDKRRMLIFLISKLLQKVEDISEEIVSFEKISGWLQNVAVLSRIELTRSLSLKQMTESVDDMADLVDRIQEQIKRGENETGDFIKATGLVFSEYEAYAAEEQEYMERFTGTFIDSIKELSSVNNSFSEVLGDFNFFSDKFKDLFEVSSGEMEQMKKLSAELSGVSADLGQKKADYSLMIKKKLDEKQIHEWNISDENLNKIIDRFTIYSHKKSAGDVSGLDVEESVLETGDVTLF